MSSIHASNNQLRHTHFSSLIKIEKPNNVELDHPEIDKLKNNNDRNGKEKSYVAVALGKKKKIGYIPMFVKDCNDLIMADRDNISKDANIYQAITSFVNGSPLPSDVSPCKKILNGSPLPASDLSPSKTVVLQRHKSHELCGGKTTLPGQLLNIDVWAKHGFKVRTSKSSFNPFDNVKSLNLYLKSNSKTNNKKREKQPNNLAKNNMDVSNKTAVNKADDDSKSQVSSGSSGDNRQRKKINSIKEEKIMEWRASMTKILSEGKQKEFLDDLDELQRNKRSKENKRLSSVKEKIDTNYTTKKRIRESIISEKHKKFESQNDLKESKYNRENKGRNSKNRSYSIKADREKVVKQLDVIATPPDNNSNTKSLTFENERKTTGANVVNNLTQKFQVGTDVFKNIQFSRAVGSLNTGGGGKLDDAAAKRSTLRPSVFDGEVIENIDIINELTPLNKDNDDNNHHANGINNAAAKKSKDWRENNEKNKKRSNSSVLNETNVTSNIKDSKFKASKDEMVTPENPKIATNQQQKKNKSQDIKNSKRLSNDTISNKSKNKSMKTNVTKVATQSSVKRHSLRFETDSRKSSLPVTTSNKKASPDKTELTDFNKKVSIRDKKDYEKKKMSGERKINDAAASTGTSNNLRSENDENTDGNNLVSESASDEMMLNTPKEPFFSVASTRDMSSMNKLELISSELSDFINDTIKDLSRLDVQQSTPYFTDEISIDSDMGLNSAMPGLNELKGQKQQQQQQPAQRHVDRHIENMEDNFEYGDGKVNTSFVSTYGRHKDKDTAVFDESNLQTLNTSFITAFQNDTDFENQIGSDDKVPNTEGVSTFIKNNDLVSINNDINSRHNYTPSGNKMNENTGENVLNSDIVSNFIYNDDSTIKINDLGSMSSINSKEGMVSDLIQSKINRVGASKESSAETVYIKSGNEIDDRIIDDDSNVVSLSNEKNEKIKTLGMEVNSIAPQKSIVAEEIKDSDEQRKLITKKSQFKNKKVGILSVLKVESLEKVNETLVREYIEFIKCTSQAIAMKDEISKNSTTTIHSNFITGTVLDDFSDATYISESIKPTTDGKAFLEEIELAADKTEMVDEIDIDWKASQVNILLGEKKEAGYLKEKSNQINDDGHFTCLPEATFPVDNNLTNFISIKNNADKNRRLFDNDYDDEKAVENWEIICNKDETKAVGVIDTEEQTFDSKPDPDGQTGELTSLDKKTKSVQFTNVIVSPDDSTKVSHSVSSKTKSEFLCAKKPKSKYYVVDDSYKITEALADTISLNDDKTSTNFEFSKDSEFNTTLFKENNDILLADIVDSKTSLDIANNKIPFKKSCRRMSIADDDSCEKNMEKTPTTTTDFNSPVICGEDIEESFYSAECDISEEYFEANTLTTYCDVKKSRTDTISDCAATAANLGCNDLLVSLENGVDVVDVDSDNSKCSAGVSSHKFVSFPDLTDGNCAITENCSNKLIKYDELRKGNNEKYNNSSCCENETILSKSSGQDFLCDAMTISEYKFYNTPTNNNSLSELNDIGLNNDKDNDEYNDSNTTSTIHCDETNSLSNFILANNSNKLPPYSNSNRSNSLFENLHPLASQSTVSLGIYDTDVENNSYKLFGSNATIVAYDNSMATINNKSVCVIRSDMSEKTNDISRELISEGNDLLSMKESVDNLTTMVNSCRDTNNNLSVTSCPYKESINELLYENEEHHVSSFEPISKSNSILMRNNNTTISTKLESNSLLNNPSDYYGTVNGGGFVLKNLSANFTNRPTGASLSEFYNKPSNTLLSEFRFSPLLSNNKMSSFSNIMEESAVDKISNSNLLTEIPRTSSFDKDINESDFSQVLSDAPKNNNETTTAAPIESLKEISNKKVTCSFLEETIRISDVYTPISNNQTIINDGRNDLRRNKSDDFLCEYDKNNSFTFQTDTKLYDSNNKYGKKDLDASLILSGGSKSKNILSLDKSQSKNTKSTITNHIPNCDLYDVSNGCLKTMTNSVNNVGSKRDSRLDINEKQKTNYFRTINNQDAAATTTTINNKYYPSRIKSNSNLKLQFRNTSSKDNINNKATTICSSVYSTDVTAVPAVAGAVSRNKGCMQSYKNRNSNKHPLSTTSKSTLTSTRKFSYEFLNMATSETYMLGDDDDLTYNCDVKMVKSLPLTSPANTMDCVELANEECRKCIELTNGKQKKEDSLENENLIKTATHSNDVKYVQLTNNRLCTIDPMTMDTEIIRGTCNNYRDVNNCKEKCLEMINVQAVEEEEEEEKRVMPSMDLLEDGNENLAGDVVKNVSASVKSCNDDLSDVERNSKEFQAKRFCQQYSNTPVAITMTNFDDFVGPHIVSYLDANDFNIKDQLSSCNLRLQSPPQANNTTMDMKNDDDKAVSVTIDDKGDVVGGGSLKNELNERQIHMQLLSPFDSDVFPIDEKRQLVNVDDCMEKSDCDCGGGDNNNNDDDVGVGGVVDLLDYKNTTITLHVGETFRNFTTASSSLKITHLDDNYFNVLEALKDLRRDDIRTHFKNFELLLSPFHMVFTRGIYERNYCDEKDGDGDGGGGGGNNNDDDDDDFLDYDAKMKSKEVVKKTQKVSRLNILLSPLETGLLDMMIGDVVLYADHLRTAERCGKNKLCAIEGLLSPFDMFDVPLQCCYDENNNKDFKVNFDNRKNETDVQMEKVSLDKDSHDVDLDRPNNNGDNCEDDSNKKTSRKCHCCHVPKVVQVFCCCRDKQLTGKNKPNKMTIDENKISDNFENRQRQSVCFADADDDNDDDHESKVVEAKNDNKEFVSTAASLSLSSMENWISQKADSLDLSCNLKRSSGKSSLSSKRNNSKLCSKNSTLDDLDGNLIDKLGANESKVSSENDMKSNNKLTTNTNSSSLHIFNDIPLLTNDIDTDASNTNFDTQSSLESLSKMASSLSDLKEEIKLLYTAKERKSFYSSSLMIPDINRNAINKLSIINEDKKSSKYDEDDGNNNDDDNEIKKNIKMNLISTINKTSDSSSLLTSRLKELDLDIKNNTHSKFGGGVCGGTAGVNNYNNYGDLSSEDIEKLVGKFDDNPYGRVLSKTETDVIKEKLKDGKVGTVSGMKLTQFLRNHFYYFTSNSNTASTCSSVTSV